MIINWMKYRYLYIFFSLMVIIPGTISLLTNGLKLSIDFTGGTTLQLSGVSDSQKILESLKDHQPSVIESKGDVLSLRMVAVDQSTADSIISAQKETNKDLQIISFETLGPSMGAETIKKTIIAIILASILLLLHISNAFKQIKFGVFALIAMLHDTLVLLGIFSLLGKFANVEIDLLFVTATLTILSFSVHDTIVVYDRVRELSRSNNTLPMHQLANMAVSETMIRSLNNSLTIIFMLLALVLLGGDTTRNFALALLIGTISGSYSSPFTAVPLLVIWDDYKNKRK